MLEPGFQISEEETIDGPTLEALLQRASALRAEGHGRTISYSRKVFIPLTRLCRDACRYCTFARSPGKGHAPYLSPDEVLSIARKGKASGCHEALFTLGDKPELRYRAARNALTALGYNTTVEYLAAMCGLVRRETGLFPHVNAGVMTQDEMAQLRLVSVSQGIMLESASERLCAAGGPHFGSPDKHPQVRLKMIAEAGKLKIPFTSGILIGIGETRTERVESLFALLSLHKQFGHLQEIIIQNFRAKPSTRMALHAEPSLHEVMWTAAVARLIFGPEMNIQVPPNLSYQNFPRLLDAGINDWGGVSPVTPDHVNPEAPWPELQILEQKTADAGFRLAERFAVYPQFLRDPSWIEPDLRAAVLRSSDAFGYARLDDWAPGTLQEISQKQSPPSYTGSLDKLLERASSGLRLSESQIVELFRARGEEVDVICDVADELRKRESGETVRYVVNRNINYTNVCTYKCRFCAFSKGKTSLNLRGTPYDLSYDELGRRAEEAWSRGATEVCMQGGINPHYTGDTYLGILKAVKDAVPNIHVHAFSPLEVSHGAATLGISVAAFLEKLLHAGLGSLPGTAAEILDDEVRAIICPDKLSTRDWVEIVRQAHRAGLRTTSTMMFGHVESPLHWARHLLALRDLQEETRGFTEFVPLPFVHMEAPMYLHGRSRKGPTWREVRLVHAVARLVLNPAITNIQASWVKLGTTGVRVLLNEGVNDLGGTLMNESISRAAGTQHGQELGPLEMEALIQSVGRTSQQRTTLYGSVSREQYLASFNAAALSEIVQTPYRARPSTGNVC